jgi:hypothetical protein
LDSNSPNIMKGMVIGVAQKMTILMDEMRKT